MGKILVIFITFIFLLIPSISHSKTFAYILFEDGIIKFDTETNTEVSRINAPSRLEGFFGNYKNAGCTVDVANNYLIGLYKYGFYIYELKTLKDIKYILYPDIIKKPTSRKIIYPLKGTKFYIEIEDMALNNGQGGIANLAYDKKTFDYLGTVDNLLVNMKEKFWFSEDQNAIYVESAEHNIRVYDSQTLALLNNIDLSSIYASNLWSKEIQDIKNGVVFLKENKKLQLEDKNKFYFLTFKIADGSQTLRVLTDVQHIDEALLVPNSSKAIFNDVSYAPSALPFLPKGTISSTVLHTYDVNSGNKLGLIPFDSNFGGEILGIRPQGDKLYYFMYSTDQSKMRLAAVDLVNYKVIKEITVPNLFFKVFFEE